MEYIPYIISVFECPNNYENIEDTFASEIIGWLKHMRTKNVAHSHNIIRLDIFGNNFSLKSMENIDNQI